MPYRSVIPYVITKKYLCSMEKFLSVFIRVAPCSSENIRNERISNIYVLQILANDKVEKQLVGRSPFILNVTITFFCFRQIGWKKIPWQNSNERTQKVNQWMNRHTDFTWPLSSGRHFSGGNRHECNSTHHSQQWTGQHSTLEFICALFIVLDSWFTFHKRIRCRV